MAHDLAHAHALASQVGGHPGIKTTDDGSLLIKPCLPLELAFYQSSLSDPDFAALAPFIPHFYGTLALQGKLPEGATDPTQGIVPADGNEEGHELVLENASHSFLKPNILDIKLGTVLYDDGASEEKKERMLKTARETTSLETGVRLTGFQVYNNNTGEPVNTPKSYGKSIKPADLPDGIARFFPVASTADPLGLPADTLLPILEGVREDVAELRAALADIHLRMVGGSVLIVYEADWARAKEALTKLEEERARLQHDSDEEDEEDEESDEDDELAVGPPYVVKLIDFAHTRMAPGQGPDEGVLLGLDTTLKLLDGRIEQVRALVPPPQT